MGIYIKGDFKNPYPNCDKCIFGELIQCEAVTRREVYDYDVDCPLSEIEVSDDAISRKWLLNFFVGFPDDYTLTIGNLRAVINDAPSVVPTTEQSSIVGERKDK